MNIGGVSITGYVVEANLVVVELVECMVNKVVLLWSSCLVPALHCLHAFRALSLLFWVSTGGTPACECRLKGVVGEVTIGGVNSVHYTEVFVYTNLESTNFSQVELDDLEFNVATARATTKSMLPCRIGQPPSSSQVAQSVAMPPTVPCTPSTVPSTSPVKENTGEKCGANVGIPSFSGAAAAGFHSQWTASWR